METTDLSSEKQYVFRWFISFCQINGLFWMIWVLSESLISQYMTLFHMIYLSDWQSPSLKLIPLLDDGDVPSFSFHRKMDTSICQR